MPTLPILRPPVFVIINGLDYLLGSYGIILALFFAVSIFGTFYFVIKIIEFQINDLNQKWYALPVLLATTIYPLNYIKIYLLSDSICVFICLAASYFFIKYHNTNRTSDLISSTLLFLIAGLTQTYGLIPFVILFGLGFLITFNQNRKKSALIIVMGISIIISFFLLTILWRNSIPHLETPKNFELLKLSFEMLPFYIGVWGYYLLPFLTYFFISRSFYLKKISIENFVGIASILIVFVFTSFCFFYQWQESRFTYYLWAWLLIAVSINVELKVANNKIPLVLNLILILTCLITPDNYWAPTSNTLKIAPGRHRLVSYFNSQPINRQLASCFKSCDNNEFLSKSDEYINSVIKIYNQIKLFCFFTPQ